MFSKKPTRIAAVMILAGLAGASSAPAQHSACPYNLASLQGSYAVVLTYGANVAAGFQTESLDGKGNLTRIGIINQPTAGSATGARTIVPVSTAGTYTVNCDGTGVFTTFVTRPDGSTASGTADFIITAATGKDGRLIATTISDAQREPSVIIPGGIFLTRLHTRLPPPHEFEKP